MQENELAQLASSLVPLADLFLRSGYGASHITRATKLAIIAAASKNARIGNRLNHSRIAAATGLTRKEIRLLMQSTSSQKAASKGQPEGQRTSRVLEGWKTDPAFLTDLGTPASLTVRGHGATFPKLVRHYGGDVTPMAVLKELQRLGVVTKERDNKIKLKKSSLRSPGIDVRRVAEFAERMRGIGAALIEDVSAEPNKRSTVFESSKDLSPKEAALFMALFSARASELIDGAERWYRGRTGDSTRTHARSEHILQRVAIRIVVSEEEHQD
jgi:hypothetical protein